MRLALYSLFSEPIDSHSIHQTCMHAYFSSPAKFRQWYITRALVQKHRFSFQIQKYYSYDIDSLKLHLWSGGRGDGDQTTAINRGGATLRPRTTLTWKKNYIIIKKFLFVYLSKKFGNALSFFYANKIKFCSIIYSTFKQKEKAQKKKFLN